MLWRKNTFQMYKNLRATKDWLQAKNTSNNYHYDDKSN